MNENKIYRVEVRSKSASNHLGTDRTEVMFKRPCGKKAYTPTESSCTRLDFLHLNSSLYVFLLYIFGSHITLVLKRKE